MIKSHEGNTEDYYKLKDLLIANLHHFDKKESKDLLDLVIGYCVNLGNKGMPEFERDLLSGINEGLKTTSLSGMNTFLQQLIETLLL